MLNMNFTSLPYSLYIFSVVFMSLHCHQILLFSYCCTIKPVIRFQNQLPSLVSRNS